MTKGIAARINIAEELAAAARGECLCCRIGARHGTREKPSPCPGAAAVNDLWCAWGGHEFTPEHWTDNGTRLVPRGPCLWCGARP